MKTLARKPLWIFLAKELALQKHWVLAWPCSHTDTKGNTDQLSEQLHLYSSLKSRARAETLRNAQGWNYFSAWPFSHTWPGNNYRTRANHCIWSVTLCQLPNTNTGCRMKFTVAAAYSSKWNASILMYAFPSAQPLPSLAQRDLWAQSYNVAITRKAPV